jgi:hypothetical protein
MTEEKARDYRNAVIAEVVPGVDPVVHQAHADWMSGNVDTSDTADLIQNQVAAISPAFALHRRNAAVQAARALDPHDLGVSRRAVVLPHDHEEAQKVRQGLVRAADYAVDHPIILGGPAGDNSLMAAEMVRLTKDDGAAPEEAR